MLQYPYFYTILQTAGDKKLQTHKYICYFVFIAELWLFILSIMQNIIQKSKRWDYSDIPDGGHKYINSSWPGVAYMRHEKQLPFP